MKIYLKEIWCSAIGMAFVLTGAAAAAEPALPDEVSPARRIEPRAESREDRTRRPPSGGQPAASVRTIDGTDNNVDDTLMNAADTPLTRLMDVGYDDGLAAMAGIDRPSARLISNLICDQSESIENRYGTSDFLWQWGQFVDHDIDLTDGIDPPELEPIAVPAGDVYFDPDATGDVVIQFNRSLYEHEPTGLEPRQQTNEITGWIDASNVYGSSAARAAALRANDGTGRLRTGVGDLLPDDETDLPNATGGSPQVMFLAGDVRANEQVALTAMHTLFMREHNRMANRIRARQPELVGDEVYQRARAYVAGLMQAITYREFLPALLGPRALSPYDGYRADMDARVANSFSAAAYRFGHSALSPTLQRLDARMQIATVGSLDLRDAFFSPDRIREDGGIEPLLRGLSSQRHQRIDAMIIDDVRNFLFGLPGQGGFDLASLNVQRGRDHGLPSYVEARVAYGFDAPLGFEDVAADALTQARLAAAYEEVGDVDLWVGGLAESPTGGSQLGPLFTAMLTEQFEALRDGDRFWYERALPPGQVEEIQATRLSDVIRRNTSIDAEISDDVFRVSNGRPERRGSSRDDSGGSGFRR